MRYRREIDGLRAIAVLPVIFFHAGFGLFSGGYIGVDVFFVISGYLITSILIADLERGHFSLASFYERRARRILPALFFVILASLPFAYLWMWPAQLKDFAESIVAVVLFASNFLFWREDGYFAAAAELKPLLHTWSLAVEEQFYLLFPLFLLVTWRFGRARVLACIIAAAASSLLLSEWGWRNEPSANFYLAPTRAWELLAGSLCAFVSAGKPQRSSDLLSIIGLALILVPIFSYDRSTPFPSVYALPPVTGSALVILFGAPNTWVARLLSTAPLVGIGLISYSAYLWHQPLFAFARLRSVTDPAPALMAALAVATLLLAYGTWRWVEQPFRHGGAFTLKTRRNFARSCAVLSAFVAATGLSLPLLASNLAHLRYTPAELRLISTAAPSPMRGACHYNRKSKFAPEDSCVYFNGELHWAVFGNSHGVELAYALANLLQERGEALAHLTISGCPVTYHKRTKPYCNDFFDSRLKHIKESKNLTKIVLAYKTDEADAEEIEDLVSLANDLTKVGKRVILVLQAPLLRTHISSIFREVDTEGNVRNRPREEWRAIYDRVYSSLDRLSSSVLVVDLAKTFCEGGVCFAARNWSSLYYDDDHMSIDGGFLAARQILKRLQQVE